MDYTTAVLLLIGCTYCAHAADKTMTEGDVSVKILGQSGKMKMWRHGGSRVSDAGNDTADVKPITIFLDSLTEVDVNGNAVGTSGSTKHTLNSFARQQFTFSTIKNGTLPHTNSRVAYVDFDSKLSHSKLLKLTVYIVKEDGEFMRGKDTIEVKKGEVKFSLELSNWAWSSSMEVNGTGAFVDVELTVQLHGNQTFKEDTDGVEKGVKKFNFGEGQSMEIPLTISIDGRYVKFPTGYPKFAIKGNKNTFTFRTQKFTTNALYNLTINNAELQGDNGGASVLASLLTIMAAMLPFYLD